MQEWTNMKKMELFTLLAVGVHLILVAFEALSKARSILI
jgi:hypothetical protein